MEQVPYFIGDMCLNKSSMIVTTTMIIITTIIWLTQYNNQQMPDNQSEFTYNLTLS